MPWHFSRRQLTALVITVIRWDIKRGSYIIPSPLLRARPDDVTPLWGSLQCSASTGVHKELLSPADFPSLHHLWLLQRVGSESLQKKPPTTRGCRMRTRGCSHCWWVKCRQRNKLDKGCRMFWKIFYAALELFLPVELNHLQLVWTTAYFLRQAV